LFGNLPRIPLELKWQNEPHDLKSACPRSSAGKIRQHSKAGGYSSASAFVRAAIERELGDRNESALVGIEERLVATVDQVRRELFRVGRAQQALFAFVDSLAKVLLTCIPEPAQAVREQAIARAKERHVRLLRTAGTSMVGDSHAAMQDLVGYGEK
jgi:hypothetical protein